jgi:hypothetical protein
MSHEDARITLSVAFTLPELYRALGKPNNGLYSTTDELVAALDDKQVYELLEELSKLYF